MKDLTRNFEDLANAIVAQAARDFAQAIVNNDEAEMKSLISFFASKWYQMLTNANPEYILRKMREGAERFKFMADCAFEDLHKLVDRPRYMFVCPICGGNVKLRSTSKISTTFPYYQYFYNRLKCTTCELEANQWIYTTESKRTRNFYERTEKNGSKRGKRLIEQRGI